MALARHDLLRLLGPLRSAGGLELVREVAECLLQELIEAEATVKIDAEASCPRDPRKWSRPPSARSSPHIPSAVRDLTRCEMVTEAMRAALEEIAHQAPQELVGLVTDEWGERHGRPARLGRTPTRPKTRIKNTGDDVYLLLC